jgi:hypothetical protein
MTTLTMQDEKRIDVIERVFHGELTVSSAAVVLGISERQCVTGSKDGSVRRALRE